MPFEKWRKTTPTPANEQSSPEQPLFTELTAGFGDTGVNPQRVIEALRFEDALADVLPSILT